MMSAFFYSESFMVQAFIYEIKSELLNNNIYDESCSESS